MGREGTDEVFADVITLGGKDGVSECLGKEVGEGGGFTQKLTATVWMGILAGRLPTVNWDGTHTWASRRLKVLKLLHKDPTSHYDN